MSEESIAYPAPGSTTGAPVGEYVRPHVIVLFGATGDLSRRKLLPGLARLAESHLAPDLRIVGTSLDELDDDGFRRFAVEAINEFGAGKLTDAQVQTFLAPAAVLQAGGRSRRARGGGGGCRGGARRRRAPRPLSERPAEGRRPR